MKKRVFKYLVLIICVCLHLQVVGQDYEEIIETNSYNNALFSESDAHKKYLKSDQEIIEFDRDQWEIIKRSIVDGMSEELYELVDSGGYVLKDADNPYKKSRKSFKKYWKKKNIKMANPNTTTKIRILDKTGDVGISISGISISFLFVSFFGSRFAL